MSYVRFGWGPNGEFPGTTAAKLVLVADAIVEGSPGDSSFDKRIAATIQEVTARLKSDG